MLVNAAAQAAQGPVGEAGEGVSSNEAPFILVALGARLKTMTIAHQRTFKTLRFARDAKKAKISDKELCTAIEEVRLGQADDLGGGVFKKRLNENRHRSIILAKGGAHWIYEYLFGKSARDNIDEDELAAFRMLAKSYASVTDKQLTSLLVSEDLLEICHDCKE